MRAIKKGKLYAFVRQLLPFLCFFVLIFYPLDDMIYPACLFNGMIHPLTLLKKEN